MADATLVNQALDSSMVAVYYYVNDGQDTYINLPWYPTAIEIYGITTASKHVVTLSWNAGDPDNYALYCYSQERDDPGVSDDDVKWIFRSHNATNLIVRHPTQQEVDLGLYNATHVDGWLMYLKASAFSSDARINVKVWR